MASSSSRVRRRLKKLSLSATRPGFQECGCTARSSLLETASQNQRSDTAAKTALPSSLGRAQ